MSKGHITNGESFIQEALLKIHQNNEEGSVASELANPLPSFPSKLRKMEVPPEWVHYLQPWSSITASSLAGKGHQCSLSPPPAPWCRISPPGKGCLLVKGSLPPSISPVVGLKLYFCCAGQDCGDLSNILYLSCLMG